VRYYGAARFGGIIIGCAAVKNEHRRLVAFHDCAANERAARARKSFPKSQEKEGTMITRRRLVAAAGATAVSASGNLIWPGPLEVVAAMADLPAELPTGTRDEAALDTLAGKKPLIKLTYRPPNYETPIDYLRAALTPNNAFFVRYHL
jgi:hypothetical protein